MKTTSFEEVTRKAIKGLGACNQEREWNGLE